MSAPIPSGRFQAGTRSSSISGVWAQPRTANVRDAARPSTMSLRAIEGFKPG